MAGQYLWLWYLTGSADCAHYTDLFQNKLFILLTLGLAVAYAAHAQTSADVLESRVLQSLMQ